jgi:hypothetical protein
MDEELVSCAADGSAEKGTEDGDPPIAEGRGKGGVSPAGEEAEEARVR